ncbi:MAG: hypothetical protein A3E81_02160 [Gammaproteobacteria bacterium RIFCSPHIGHO2_12_FULL_36_30]|nr:MAG: hypothetical protein A3E81_02160 [Gammaproteobacteria bacterium RIFCSPHIGHO2_12_FULL_36_30]
MTSTTNNAFLHFGLDPSILSAIAELGYETATPIQEQSIPILMNGEDLVAQAKTGTGKTAAFALPILTGLDKTLRAPQALILVPTRELAIQVAEAFQSYAKHINGFSVTPIYGGQDFGAQLRSIKRGTQVIVGTPGRLMDHMRRKTLSLQNLKTIVLDEADEMLKMGFADDVEWILGQVTSPHQTALFSATLPPSIQKIAQKYLKDAKKIQIKSQTNTVDAIEQSYVTVMNRSQKLDVLTRFLEVEENQATIIFTRTKTESTELAEKLQARGYSAAALNGDMSQNAREKTINRLKKGDLDVLIATDVAARGIDVERISHVINYDIPHDVDSYVHRIGRTGRAGRTGKAILFVVPREMRLFKDIEHHINKSIPRIDPPSLKEIQEKRSSQLSEKIVNAIRTKGKQIEPFVALVMELTEKESLSAKEVAAALIYLQEKETAVADFASEKSFDHSSSEKHSRRDKKFGGGEGRRNRFGGDRDRSRGKSRRPFGEFRDAKSGSGPKGAPNKSDRFERSDRSDRSERSEKPARFERSEKFPRSDSGDRKFSTDFKRSKPSRDFSDSKSPRDFKDKDDRKNKGERKEFSPSKPFERRSRPPRSFK